MLRKTVNLGELSLCSGQLVRHLAHCVWCTKIDIVDTVILSYNKGIIHVCWRLLYTERFALDYDGSGQHTADLHHILLIYPSPSGN